MSATAPRPSIDEDNQPFWAAVGQRRFVLMRCQDCGAWYWPAAYCRHHANKPFFGSLRWEEASGRGTVFASNIHHKPFHPGFVGKVPYVFALIELDEGPMFGTNIVGCPVQEVHIGMRVEVAFEQREDGVVLPVFTPSDRVPGAATGP